VEPDLRAGRKFSDHAFPHDGQRFITTRMREARRRSFVATVSSLRAEASGTHEPGHQRPNVQASESCDGALEGEPRQLALD
jgi:hypothetical protein